MSLSEDIAIIRSKLNQLVNNRKVPLNVAQRFIFDSAWWYGHPRGPVRAPKHHERVSNGFHGHGFELEFGSNYFLVETAIRRSVLWISDVLDKVEKTGIKADYTALTDKISLSVRGSVANYNGNEYEGYYSLTDGFMMFGTQAIRVNDFVNTICDFTEIYRVTTFQHIESDDISNATRNDDLEIEHKELSVINYMNNQLKQEISSDLAEIAEAVHLVHMKVSSAEKNRYDLGHGVHAWYKLGRLDYLFFDGKCIDCLSGKLIDKPIGNLDFYVNIDTRFETEYMRIGEVHLMGVEFVNYIRYVVDRIFKVKPN